MAVFQGARRASSGSRYTRGSTECCIEQPADRRDVYRLDEVVIEAGSERALAVHRLAIAGQRDQVQPLAAGQRADLARELVAVDNGKPDVEDRRVGGERAHQFE